MRQGRVRRWIHERGFGFILDDNGGPDAYFCAGNVCDPAQVEFLQAGVKVTYTEPVNNEHGWKTFHVVLTGE